MSDEINTELTPPSNRGVRSPNLARVSSRVDWLTVTTALETIGLEWLAKYKEYRQNAPQWESAVSIKGFVGMGMDGFTWTVNPDTGWYMVILSGDVAGALWRDLAPRATNITRIDFAVTVTLAESAKWVIKQHWESIPYESKQARKYALIENTDGGMTLYVGARASYNFGRVYDKGAETGEYMPGNEFRYEVENKKPYSYNVAMRIAKEVLQGSVEADVINSYVWQWFFSRGVEPIFPPEYEFTVPDVGASVTTKEAKLTWLRTAVRPTVARLIEMGLGEETMKALDLLKYTQPAIFDDDTMERLTRKIED